MYRCTVGFLLFLFAVISMPVEAATVYIDPSQPTLGRGDVEIFEVRLDTDEAADECVNAVSGVVQFSGPLTPTDVSLGESIFSIWLESPTVDADKKQVSFAGGIPNGYCGRIDGDPNLTNVLFSVVARADTEDGELSVATLSLSDDTTAYLNDGFGTQASLRTLPSTVTVLPTTNATIRDPWIDAVIADDIEPREFSITLERSEREYNRQYYILFNTSDKQTGIDHYEVMEEPLSQANLFTWGSSNADWVRATSPYVLEDQSLNSTIRVKAVDKAGNEYIATLVPEEELRTLSFTQGLTYVVAITILIALLVFGRAFISHKRRQKEASGWEELESSADEQAQDYSDLSSTNEYDHET